MKKHTSSASEEQKAFVAKSFSKYSIEDDTKVIKAIFISKPEDFPVKGDFLSAYNAIKEVIGAEKLEMKNLERQKAMQFSATIDKGQKILLNNLVKEYKAQGISR